MSENATTDFTDPLVELYVATLKTGQAKCIKIPVTLYPYFHINVNNLLSGSGITQIRESEIGKQECER